MHTCFLGGPSALGVLEHSSSLFPLPRKEFSSITPSLPLPRAKSWGVMTKPWLVNVTRSIFGPTHTVPGAPCWLMLGSCWLQLASSWPQDGSRWFYVGSSWVQDSQNGPQRLPK